MFDTLEHLRRPAEVLAKVRRSMRPGGHLLMTVPNADAIEVRLFGAHAVNWWIPLHLFHYRAQTLETMLWRAGFRELEFSWHQEAWTFENTFLRWIGMDTAEWACFCGMPGAFTRLIRQLGRTRYHHALARRLARWSVAAVRKSWRNSMMVIAKRPQ
jgi:SAM-dependent methyltransferase